MSSCSKPCMEGSSISPWAPSFSRSLWHFSLHRHQPVLTLYPSLKVMLFHTHPLLCRVHWKQRGRM